VPKRTQGQRRPLRVVLSRRGSEAPRKQTRASNSRRIKLVEIVPTTTTPRSTLYLLRLGQLALEVDAQFDETTLRRQEKTAMESHSSLIRKQPESDRQRR
jgi:hypothetical protein